MKFDEEIHFELTPVLKLIVSKYQKRNYKTCTRRILFHSKYYGEHFPIDVAGVGV